MTSPDAEPAASSDPEIASLPAPPPSTPGAAQTPPAPHANMTALTLGAIGIVFGDIGTSPLYTFQECIGGAHGVRPEPGNVLGVLSLIFWSLILVVTVKYVTFLMRADNHGEGGILALLALVPPKVRKAGTLAIPWVAVLVVAGASLLFGDGIITPAISVLSAIEGLEVATTWFHPFVVPLTVVILVGLFAIQSRGTGGIGKIFGPIMVVWFLTIGALGANQIVRHPFVLQAVNPIHSVLFFSHHHWHGFLLLGSVVLAVTGGEALYADMGHFGIHAIRRSWLWLILPALVLCYFGQGALVVATPSAAATPFFSLVPRGIATYLLVALAAPATVIASQALISGVFSLTHQAIQLGFFPRVEVKHTSSEAEGQIYVPVLNWMLAVACIAIVLAFKESSKLAAAFGLAVSGTMMITTIVYYVVTRETWKWASWKSLAILVFFLSFDVPFVVANALKFFDGGYLPLLVGAVFFIVMINWRRGRFALNDYLMEHTPTMKRFLEEIRTQVTTRIPGTAIFMSATVERVPLPLYRHVMRLRAMEETIVFVTVTTEHVPYVEDEGRVSIASVAPKMYWVIARYGFHETPDVPDALRDAARAADVELALDDATYYLGRETFLQGEGGRLGTVAESLFAFLSRNAHSAALYFGVPPNQVVELGSQIDL